MQVVLFFVVIVIVFAFFKKENVYELFCEGVENSFDSLLKMFPSIFAIIFALNIFLNSGFEQMACFKALEKNFCVELLIQIITKPISWSTSLLMMTNIFKEYGSNSKITFISSLIQGSFDTTFYVFALYSSKVKIKNFSKVLLSLILANLATVVFTLIISRFL